MKETYEFKPAVKKTVEGTGVNAANIANDQELLLRMASEKTELPYFHEEGKVSIKNVPPSFDKTGFYREHINIGKTEDEIKAEEEAKQKRKEEEERVKREAEQKEYQERWGNKLAQYERIIKESEFSSERSFARRMYEKITGKPYQEKKK